MFYKLNIINKTRGYKIKIKYHLPFFAFAIFVVSCANRVMPPGGIPIATPPEVVATRPNQGAVSVKRDSVILITFSEHMNRRVTQNSIVFYPFFERFIEFRWLDNKNLLIKPDTLLRENFVHFVTIGSSARDVYNNMLVPSFTLIFSTGDTIHQNSIRGRVFRDDFTAAAGVKLYLFKSIPTDTNIFHLRNLQYGFTETDRNGNFSFNHLAKGKYIIVGLDDKNKNFMKEDAELITRSSDTIDMYKTQDSVTSDVNLFLFREPKTVSLISASARFNNSYSVTFNSRFNFTTDELSRLFNFVTIEPFSVQKVTADTMFFRPGTNELQVFTQMPFDTLTRVKIEIDSAEAKEILTEKRALKIDSLNFSRTFFYYNTTDTTPPAIASVLPITNSHISIFTRIEATFNKPVFINDRSLITVVFKEDTAGTNIATEALAPQMYVEDGFLLRIHPITNYRRHKNGFISLTILPGAISDYIGNFNKDTIEAMYTLIPENRTGTINFTLSGTKNSPITDVSLVLFLTPTPRQNALRNEKIYVENIDNNRFSVSGIQEGTYIVRGFIDRDKNGELSHGSLINKIFYGDIAVTGSDSLRVRSGWSTDDTLRGYF